MTFKAVNVEQISTVIISETGAGRGERIIVRLPYREGRRNPHEDLRTRAAQLDLADWIVHLLNGSSPTFPTSSSPDPNVLPRLRARIAELESYFTTGHEARVIQEHEATIEKLQDKVDRLKGERRVLRDANTELQHQIEQHSRHNFTTDQTISTKHDEAIMRGWQAADLSDESMAKVDIYAKITAMGHRLEDMASTVSEHTAHLMDNEKVVAELGEKLTEVDGSLTSALRVQVNTNQDLDHRLTSFVAAQLNLDRRIIGLNELCSRLTKTVTDNTSKFASRLDLVDGHLGSLTGATKEHDERIATLGSAHAEQAVSVKAQLDATQSRINLLNDRREALAYELSLIRDIPRTNTTNDRRSYPTMGDKMDAIRTQREAAETGEDLINDPDDS